MLAIKFALTITLLPLLKMLLLLLLWPLSPVVIVNHSGSWWHLHPAHQIGILQGSPSNPPRDKCMYKCKYKFGRRRRRRREEARAVTL